ncbi:MAG: hypothetical protein JRN37_02575 [Nitrososphaerota archaeon]|nr:hypothetical protein [Nitrososphaerota archaeon]MDG7038038.1 hypothetical protein [Nitrososphaerota archaeon]
MPNFSTDPNPYTWQTVGSRGLFSDGSALLKAIDDDLCLEYENLREFYDGILSLKPKDMRNEGISEMELKRKKAEIRKGKRLNFKIQVNMILLSLYEFK